MKEKGKRKNSGKKNRETEPRPEKQLFVACPMCGEPQLMQGERFVYQCHKCQAMFEKPDDIPSRFSSSRML